MISLGVRAFAGCACFEARSAAVSVLLNACLPTCLPAYLPTCLPAYLPTCQHTMLVPARQVSWHAPMPVTTLRRHALITSIWTFLLVHGLIEATNSKNTKMSVAQRQHWPNLAVHVSIRQVMCWHMLAYAGRCWLLMLALLRAGWCWLVLAVVGC